MNKDLPWAFNARDAKASLLAPQGRHAQWLGLIAGVQGRLAYDLGHALEGDDLLDAKILVWEEQGSEDYQQLIQLGADMEVFVNEFSDIIDLPWGAESGAFFEALLWEPFNRGFHLGFDRGYLWGYHNIHGQPQKYDAPANAIGIDVFLDPAKPEDRDAAILQPRVKDTVYVNVDVRVVSEDPFDPELPIWVLITPQSKKWSDFYWPRSTSIMLWDWLINDRQGLPLPELTQFAGVGHPAAPGRRVEDAAIYIRSYRGPRWFPEDANHTVRDVLDQAIGRDAANWHNDKLFGQEAGWQTTALKLDGLLNFFYDDHVVSGL